MSLAGRVVLGDVVVEILEILNILEILRFLGLGDGLSQLSQETTRPLPFVEF
jgi:hypothetical protein